MQVQTGNDVPSISSRLVGHSIERFEYNSHCANKKIRRIGTAEVLSILQSCLDKRRPNARDIYPWYGYIMLEKVALADEQNLTFLYRLDRAIRVQWFIDCTADDDLQDAVNKLRDMNFDTVNSQNRAPNSLPARIKSVPILGLSRSNALRSRTFPIERRHRYQSEQGVEGQQSRSAYFGPEQNSPRVSDKHVSPVYDMRNDSPEDPVVSATVNDLEPLPSWSEPEEYDYENYKLNPSEVAALERHLPYLSSQSTFESQQLHTPYAPLPGSVSPLSSDESASFVSPLSNSARADSDVLGYYSDGY